MRIDFTINNGSDASARYLTWAPSPLRLRLLDATPGPDVAVTLSEDRQPNGGSVRFCATQGGNYTPTLKVSMPTNGASVMVYVRGRFGAPSQVDGDVSIVVSGPTSELGRLPVMVRVRKNANQLTAAERDRFISAMAQLNNRGTGRFTDFRNMHVAGLADKQAHDGPGFLPWHRAYLLDLERELQAINPAVTIPYWRFDRAAPNLFTTDFIGVPDALGTVSFSPANPLQFWATDGVQGILRRQLGVSPGDQANPNIRTETQTLALGGSYQNFRTMQTNPHGSAHVNYFGGSISSIPTAAKDPLFFLLHCNVDRLWAKWQSQVGRYDANVAAAYDSKPNPPNWLAGHNLNDTLWPWNGIVTPPRPSTAPGGPMADSSCVPAPGRHPQVSDMLDFQGVVNSSAKLGFAYDDVPSP
ncbi:tyrosinase family protein [Ralstonia solanacearum]|uniref:tyrosinase family protein n=1 Tax=Ralstonia solanacearum TaxID=305 RepID=UPI00123B0BDE|nr:tyrosinase family protein [Ralstonia solanacearum]AYB51353.1 tyrosinase family protein [Ralstonia solanacearum]AYB55906.1 tyrosinase family protein [Ralstonia solanacearum]